MTVPGVNVQTAATFMASVGDIRRFSSPRQLVSYLGLDPRVRQSGNAPARHGRISKAGASEAQAHARRGRLEGRPDPGTAARLLRTRARAPRPADRRDRDRPQARRALLAPADPRAGLCLRAAGDDAQQDPPARAARRRIPAEGPQGRRRQQEQGRLRGRARALAPSRGRVSPAGQRLAGHRTDRRRVRARHRGAHLNGPRRAKPRGRLRSPKVCASLRQSPAPNTHDRKRAATDAT